MTSEQVGTVESLDSVTLGPSAIRMEGRNYRLMSFHLEQDIEPSDVLAFLKRERERPWRFLVQDAPRAKDHSKAPASPPKRSGH